MLGGRTVALAPSLHLGVAGLAASIYFVNGARNLAPETERQNWSAGQALEVFESRLGLVTRQFARSPYLCRRDVHGSRHSVTYTPWSWPEEVEASPSAGHRAEAGAGPGNDDPELPT
jgi:hypothetical protein